MGADNETRTLYKVLPSFMYVFLGQNQSENIPVYMHEAMKAFHEYLSSR